MPATLASLLAWTVEIYLAIGLVLGAWFVTAGAARVDPRVHGAPLGFRLLILPGSMMLWPLCLSRVLRRSEAA